MNKKFISAILLIVGTSIGGGMLALPVATAALGFWWSVVLLFVCWLLMTAGALCVLEANLWLPENTNMISMARLTLGPVGQIAAWLSYCLLLYALLSAYISAGSDLTAYLLSLTHAHLPQSVASLLFTFIFGGIVFLGIHMVDKVNRGLMFLKFLSYVLLIALLLPFVNPVHFDDGSIKTLSLVQAIMVTITSFGFAIIVPSLRVFFAGDKHTLRKAVILGSLVPLICYIIWDMVIMGVVPLSGDHGLIAVSKAAGSTSTLVQSLTLIADTHVISLLARVFTSICVLTSFLGVSLCMMDFMADALQLEKTNQGSLYLATISFLPPLLLVVFFPHIFITALAYAGVDCVVLLMLLPALMVFSGRYFKHLPKHISHVVNKPLLVLVILIAIGLIAYAMI